MWVDIGGVTPGWNWPEGLLLCWPIGVVVLRAGAEAQVGLVVNEGGGDDDVVAGRCLGSHHGEESRLTKYVIRGISNCTFRFGCDFNVSTATRRLH